MRLFTIEDQNRLVEARRISEKRVLELANVLVTKQISESRGFDIGEALISEAYRLEKLTIIEGLSDQDFNKIQKNFRSLLKPADLLIQTFSGTELATKLNALRVETLELLNEMWEDVKNVEDGIKLPVANKKISQARDKFAKSFSNFAILMKGSMALGDLFSGGRSSLGDYTTIKEISSSLDLDGLLSVPLKNAFEVYEKSVKANSLNATNSKEEDSWFKQGDEMEWVTDTSKGAVPTTGFDSSARPSHLKQKKKPGFFARLFGKKSESLSHHNENVLSENKKMSHLEKKFRDTLQSAMVEKSPGFAKMIDVPSLVDSLMNKTFDDLSKSLKRLNNLVAREVDIDFLSSVVNKPLSVSGALKSVWDAFSSGSMGGPRGRS